MCGILVLGWNAASTQGPTAQTRHFSTVEFADCLAARGPDQQGETKVQSQGLLRVALAGAQCSHRLLLCRYMLGQERSCRCVAPSSSCAAARPATRP